LSKQKGWRHANLFFVPNLTLAIMHRRNISQTFCRLFGGQIALHFGEHFIPDNKFSYRRVTMLRGLLMRVKLPMRILHVLLGRRAVPTHRIRE
jgi:hypothetical protein